MSSPDGYGNISEHHSVFLLHTYPSTAGGAPPIVTRLMVNNYSPSRVRHKRLRYKKCKHCKYFMKHKKKRLPTGPYGAKYTTKYWCSLKKEWVLPNSSANHQKCGVGHLTGIMIDEVIKEWREK
jgi:hypothetical protein